jgi:ankyrin repeat protein
MQHKSSAEDQLKEYNQNKLDKALGKAAAKNDIHEVIRLIAAGANVNSKHGYYPLHWGISNANAEMVECLLAAGADPNQYDGDLPLGLTAKLTTSLPIIQSLLKYGALINATSPSGMSALMEAVGHSTLAMVEILIQAKADVNATTLDQTTVLHKAAEKNDIEKAKALIQAGAKINVRDQWGRMPIDLAKHTAVCQLLLESGALFETTANTKTDDRNLIKAAYLGQTAEIVQLLKTANINIQDDLYHNTSLHWAILHGHSEAAQTLIAAGADVNVLNNNAENPLMIAIIRNNKSLFDLLITKSKVNVITQDGDNILLQIAARYKNEEMIQALYNAGAYLRIFPSGKWRPAIESLIKLADDDRLLYMFSFIHPSWYSYSRSR